MSERKITAVSMYRHNGGIATKRKWGSSTVTEFAVYYADEGNERHSRPLIKAFGKTPGDRKTFAINRFKEMEAAKVPSAICDRCGKEAHDFPEGQLICPNEY